MENREIEVIISMTGSLPQKYLKYKKRIEERIKDDIEEMLGEYEIGGEFFGNDENIYTFFLENVRLEERWIKNKQM